MNHPSPRPLQDQTEKVPTSQIKKPWLLGVSGSIQVSETQVPMLVPLLVLGTYLTI